MKKKTLLDRDLDVSKVLGAGSQEDLQGFIPLPLRSLKKNQEIPFDVFLRVKPKNRSETTFLSVCSKGMVFQGVWRQKLEDLQVPQVFISTADETHILPYLLRDLETPPEYFRDEDRAALVYDSTLIWLRQSFRNLQERAAVEVGPVSPLLANLMGLMKKENYWDIIMPLMEGHGSIYSHSLNVCFLGLAFIDYLGWSAKSAQVFGLGALLHDLGMSKVPAEILNKKGALTEEEMDKVRLHPLSGYHLLKNHAWMYHNALLMVLQHHENEDGSGYPQKLLGTSIHLWAKVLRLVDSYEAMTSRRPWREAMSPGKALWSIRQGVEEQHIYDPVLFKTFVKFLAEHEK